MTAGLRITTADALTDDDRARVAEIEAAAVDVDGVAPLDDQVRLDVAHRGEPAVQHLLARLPDTTVAGYAHLRRTEDGPVSAHLVIDPAHRRHGIATALVRRMIAESGAAGLRVWAHGDEAAAGLLSGRVGFRRVRDLWQMRRALDAPLTPPTYPADVIVRTFEVGRDEAAWVDVNAAAFASHPEQGRLTADDLHQRIGQPWFDPLGLFLAERDGALVGYHWTKVHLPGEKAAHAMGEVYAVGVSPDAQGLGLGKALTATGLLHLRARGLTEVLLYVEADNGPAVAVYEKLGFTPYAVDVMYEYP